MTRSKKRTTTTPQVVKPKTTITRTVEIHRHSCGMNSGLYGDEYSLIRKDMRPQCPREPAIAGGFSFSGFFNQWVGNGAVLEVTVKVVRAGKLKRNPLRKGAK